VQSSGQVTETPEQKAAAPETPKPERHLATTIFNLVVFVVGGAALWWMLRNQNWSEFRAMLADVGWSGYAIVIGLELGSLCCDAAALHAFMRPEARMIHYWRVLGAQAAGRAINGLTPGGALGEATKLTMLVRHAPRTRVLSSIVLLNLTQVYLTVTVMLIGVPITLLLVDLPDGVKVTVGIGLAIIVPALIALGVMIHRGAVATLIGGLRGIRLISRERAATWRTKLAEVDGHIRELHVNRSAGTWKGILWVGASKLISWCSLFVLLHLVGVTLTPRLVIGLLSVGQLVTWISAIVPFGLGVADGSNYALYGMLGATGAQGLLITMLTRARMITIAVLGLIAMAGIYAYDRVRQHGMRKRLDAMRAQQA
jgi:uncharacterized membrane protein YbhN (UPF0104 family)